MLLVTLQLLFYTQCLCLVLFVISLHCSLFAEISANIIKKIKIHKNLEPLNFFRHYLRNSVYRQPEYSGFPLYIFWSSFYTFHTLPDLL